MSLVLVSATVLGYLQIRHLTEKTEVLTGTSVPAFIRAEDVERQLNGLKLTLHQIQNAENLEDLQRLKVSLDTQQNVLKNNIETLFLSDLPTDAAEKLNTALQQIESHGAGLVALQRGILELENALLQSEQALRQRQASARRALEKFTQDASQQIDKIASDMPASAEKLEQVFSRNLQQANAVTGLTLEVGSLIEMTSRISRVLNSDGFSVADKEIREKTGKILGLLERFPPSLTREALGEEIRIIQERILGETGILDQALKLQMMRQAFGERLTREGNSIAAISDRSDTFRAETRQQVEDVALLLDTTTQKVVTILIAANLASIAVFGFANVLVVERQINQRMSRLTKAVSAIAANETEYEVGIDGEDELGEMALALETFKTTAEELRRSNSELENFAYVAAHDLRSPLRAIQDISEWLMEDDENQLSEESLENISLLRSRVDRLNLLLTDLLTYSRVGNEKSDLAKINLSELVGVTRELLDVKSGFMIYYSGTQDDVFTFATPLRQILLNLISNGIKHHDAESGWIKVTGSVSEGRLVVSVEDDGPGIEPQYHDRVFGLFQTLRPRDEVEGSGLGLAIIRKLVEHYGGEISVASNPDEKRGTKFQFDLPVKSGFAQSQNLAA